MLMVYSSETSGFLWTAWYYNPDDHTLLSCLFSMFSCFHKLPW
jgi:hypothetical protein